MRLSDFDYPLPAELIAREPLAERDGSRLLCLPRAGTPLEHRAFRDLPELLEPGDLLVVNEAKVARARLRGRKSATGGHVELLVDRLLRPVVSPDGRLEGGLWLCLGQASKSFASGQRLDLGEGLRGCIEEVRGGGWLAVRLEGDPFGSAACGELPLPPYFDRPPAPQDDERYQTVFARVDGAVAAPTAGLHFTQRVFEALAARGVRVERLSLLVGAGTFLPVRTERIEDHRMHPERYEIPEALSEAVSGARGRVVAVGTTSLRALEAAWDGRRLRPGPGETELFVRPGHRFEVVDGLLTNFHQPRSTLLMLVAALAGRERVLAAYAEAVARRYRFFSYGDCMLLL